MKPSSTATTTQLNKHHKSREETGQSLQTQTAAEPCTDIKSDDQYFTTGITETQSAKNLFALILSVDNTTPTLMVSERYPYSTITFPQLPSVHLRDTSWLYSTHGLLCHTSPLTAIYFPRRHGLLFRTFSFFFFLFFLKRYGLLHCH